MSACYRIAVLRRAAVLAIARTMAFQIRQPCDLVCRTMTEPGDKEPKGSGTGSRPVLELESTARWIGGKSQQELLQDLKAYSARLRDNPHSLPDRLRVAAIQLRLGRVDEALIHYEGVLRGYVNSGQILSGIALCERILKSYPTLPRIQRILAALYARAPHGSTAVPGVVTPVGRAGGIVLDEGEDTKRRVVNRLFSGQQPSDGRDRDLLSSEIFRPALLESETALEAMPTTEARSPAPTSGETRAARVGLSPLGPASEGPEDRVRSRSASREHAPAPDEAETAVGRRRGTAPLTGPVLTIEAAQEGDPVVLLTRPKSGAIKRPQ
jgi:hypothetical protein